MHFNVLVVAHGNVNMRHLWREAIVCTPAQGNTKLIDMQSIFARPGLSAFWLTFWILKIDLNLFLSFSYPVEVTISPFMAAVYIWNKIREQDIKIRVLCENIELGQYRNTFSRYKISNAWIYRIQNNWESKNIENENIDCVKISSIASQFQTPCQ